MLVPSEASATEQFTATPFVPSGTVPPGAGVPIAYDKLPLGPTLHVRTPASASVTTGSVKVMLKPVAGGLAMPPPEPPLAPEPPLPPSPCVPLVPPVAPVPPLALAPPVPAVSSSPAAVALPQPNAASSNATASAAVHANGGTAGCFGTRPSAKRSSRDRTTEAAVDMRKQKGPRTVARVGCLIREAGQARSTRAVPPKSIPRLEQTRL